MHGWTQSALEDHPDFPALQWQSEDVVTSSVLGLVQERQEMGMRLGEDDLFLEDEAPVPCQILLCHEGDLHLKTRDSGLVAALQAALFPLGVSLIRRSESVA
ncbi:hypothetical protein DEMA109039_03405 [Deinococcus marmoris]